jgi:hypothetical protein
MCHVDQSRQNIFGVCQRNYRPGLSSQIIESRSKTTLLASTVLPAASEDKFCNARNDQTLFSSIFDFPLATKVSTNPGYFAMTVLFDGNRVRLHRISKHLV